MNLLLTWAITGPSPALPGPSSAPSPPAPPAWDCQSHSVSGMLHCCLKQSCHSTHRLRWLYIVVYLHQVLYSTHLPVSSEDSAAAATQSKTNVEEVYLKICSTACWRCLTDTAMCRRCRAHMPGPAGSSSRCLLSSLHPCRTRRCLRRGSGRLTQVLCMLRCL